MSKAWNTFTFNTRESEKHNDNFIIVSFLMMLICFSMMYSEWLWRNFLHFHLFFQLIYIFGIIVVIYQQNLIFFFNFIFLADFFKRFSCNIYETVIVQKIICLLQNQKPPQGFRINLSNVNLCRNVFMLRFVLIFCKKKFKSKDEFVYGITLEKYAAFHK